MDEFSENFQTASDPPHPIFGNLCCAFSGGPKIYNEIHSDWRDLPLIPKIHRFYPPKITEKTATKFFGSEKWITSGLQARIGTIVIHLNFFVQCEEVLKQSLGLETLKL